MNLCGRIQHVAWELERRREYQSFIHPRLGQIHFGAAEKFRSLRNQSFFFFCLQLSFIAVIGVSVHMLVGGH